MNQPIEEIQQRTKQYWYIDGLAEIGSGCLFLLLGCFEVVSKVLLPLPYSALVSGIGQPIFLILCAIGIRAAVLALKERITYPRTGYLSYRKPKTGRKWLSMILSLIIGAVVMGLTLWMIPVLGTQWVLAATGVLVGLILTYLWQRLGLIRFLIMAALIFISGLGLSLLQISSPWDNVLFLSILGLIWAGSGVSTLVKYLHSTKAAAVESSEEEKA